MQIANYNDRVFINCPFDSDYMPLLQAIVFGIYRCGFYPVCALEEDDGTDNRLDKIERCIESCRYGIHDISRTEVNTNNYPRFNMPFEIGLFFGAKRYGDRMQKNKNALIFERVKYSYLECISDLKGIDAKAHNNDPDTVLEKIRNWLTAASRRTTIPGVNKLRRDFKEFKAELPAILNDLGIDGEEILYNDYCQIVEEAIKEKI